MKELWKKYSWIPVTVFGSAIFALGFAMFLMPNDMNPGGRPEAEEILTDGAEGDADGGL